MIQPNDGLHERPQLFDINNNDKQIVDENKKGNWFKKSFSFIDCIFDRIERICIMLWSDYLNEEDLAILFRLPDPKNKGKNTIRNYALRSKKISFAKVGRQGLLFNRRDIDKLYEALRSDSVNDL